MSMVADPFPNFFIVGAPKCGTTTVSNALTRHPNVFFCDPKEPFFWSEDFPKLRTQERLACVDDYLQLFRNAEPRHQVIAEGSTNYLYSQVAIPAIMKFNPQARFLAIVRNPAEAAYSFHDELVYTSNEDESNFERAWRMQDVRRSGQRVPQTCRAEQWLQYEKVMSFGEQLERFFEVVPEPQRLVLLFDDVAKDTRGTYLKILQFVGLKDDGQCEFDRAKSARQVRFAAVHRFLRLPPKPLAVPMLYFRRYVAKQNSGMIGQVKRLLVRSRKRPELSPEFHEELKRCFEPEVRRVESLLQTDLQHWLAG